MGFVLCIKALKNLQTTSLLGGRNRKVSEAFVKTGKTIKQLEDEMLNGQKLQGPITAEEVNFMLKSKGMEDKSVPKGSSNSCQAPNYVVIFSDSPCLRLFTRFARVQSNRKAFWTACETIRNTCKSKKLEQIFQFRFGRYFLLYRITNANQNVSTNWFSLDILSVNNIISSSVTTKCTVKLGS